ncbi:MAG TPA: DUF6599 family protein [Terriglobales bacterium]
MRRASLLCTFLLLSASVRAQGLIDCHAVPGWEQAGQARQYTPDNLFDYRDGAAEGYLQFGFARMQGADCSSRANTLAIDVSEMSDAEMAYGMFAANRDPSVPVSKIGMGAQVQSQNLSFAKGKYYIELVVTDAAPGADFTPVLKGFAANIEAKLTGESTPPAVLSWFPEEGLTEARLMPESVLGLRVLKRGYVAKYAQGQAFVLAEESSDAAAAVMRSLREKLAGTETVKLGDDAFQGNAQYLEGICIFRKGRYIGGFANLPDAGQAQARAKMLLARVP